MRENKVLKIDFSKQRLREKAERYYGEGDYLSALRFTYREISLYGGDGEAYTRLSDIYENMELYTSAVNCWFRFMDSCSEEDLPDIYEGLAVNYLNMGNEAQSAFYYNKLIDVDDTLPDDYKEDITEAFSEKKKSNFRFVYPPHLADYTKETEEGARALKAGDLKKAISLFSGVEKGSREYEAASEMKAVAYLLMEKPEKAEKICLGLVKDNPRNVQAYATLAAVYTEQGREEESRQLAFKLCELEDLTPEQLYKVATVCCENGLHEQALERFCMLEKEIPYDGNMLYFKGVSACKSGKFSLSRETFEKLCTIYPDAAVAEYYLKELRRMQGDADFEKANSQSNTADPSDKFTYFYRLPDEERKARRSALIRIGKYPRSEAEIFGALAHREGYFHWCFDEMDGMDHDLQYLAVITAEHARVDEFLREVLLDCEVSDILKIEILRLLYERNEENTFGVVICNIYREMHLDRIKIGQKKRKKFVEAYAKTASKFAIINDIYGLKIHKAAEHVYRFFAKEECWELAENANDLACAFYILSGLKEMGRDGKTVASAFEASPERVEAILRKVLQE